MKKLVISVFSAFVSGAATLSTASITPASLFAGAPLSDDSAAVARAVTEYHKALDTGDSATALRLLSSDAVVLESGGIETLADYRSHHLPEDIKFARAVPSERSALKVKVDGRTAWTSGTSTSRGEFNGRSINSMGAESMVLSKDASGWKIRQIHWSSRTRRNQ